MPKSATRKKARTVRINGGDTFQVDNPNKKWTKSDKYEKWVNKLTRKKPKRTKDEDLCVGVNNMCNGDLGIRRKYMPQFNDATEIARFKKFVRKAYGIKSFKSTRKARQLRPSQGEISKKRVEGLVEEGGIFKKVNVPLIVSGDNFVIDGHHRWAAFRLEKPEKGLPVVVIDAPAKDVLGIAVAWGAKHEDF
jgi:hypothetical protein